MSAEYSVEEVREEAASFARVFNDRVCTMLTDHADLLDRIAADDELCSPTLTECPRCKNDHAAALADPKCTMTRPPAHAAQVDVKQTAEYSYGHQQALQDTAAQPRAVPDGWALVPVNPTPAMDSAGQDAVDAWLTAAVDTGEAADGKSPAAWTYKAMLAAAPQPGESE